MSPSRTTIILDASKDYSITYNPSDDSLIANLPNSLPISKVQNKPKLMLLIYFAQRDVERKRDPRRIDAQIAVELRIVERIIWQFSNFDQAVRTLKEYTRIDDYIDTSNGLLSTRGQNGVRDQKTVRNIIKMTVTKEVQETIREWMRDILAPQRSHASQAAKKSNATQAEVVDLSESISEDDDLQVLPAPQPKRKRDESKKSKQLQPPVRRRTLTPTSPGKRADVTIGSDPPSDLYPLFPSSPPPPPGDVTTAVPTTTNDVPTDPLIKAKSPAAQEAKVPSPKEELEPMDTNEPEEDTKEPEEDSMEDDRTLEEKILQYAEIMYYRARDEQVDQRKLKKYTRKLLRSARQLVNDEKEVQE